MDANQKIRLFIIQVWHQCKIGFTLCNTWTVNLLYKGSQLWTEDQFEVFVDLPIYTHLHWISAEFYIKAAACQQKSAKLCLALCLQDIFHKEQWFMIYSSCHWFQTNMFFILSNTKVGIVGKNVFFHVMKVSRVQCIFIHCKQKLFLTISDFVFLSTKKGKLEYIVNYQFWVNSPINHCFGKMVNQSYLLTVL